MNDDETYNLDSEPFDAWIDGIVENGLIEARKKNPEIAAKAIDEWEKAHGRKIGTATPEEIAYRESAWNPITSSE